MFDLNCYFNSRRIWEFPSALTCWTQLFLCCFEDINTPLKLNIHTFLWGNVFLRRRFFLLKVYKFHHTMLVLNAFPAISEGLNLKIFPRSMPPPPRWLTLKRSEWAHPQLKTCCAIQNNAPPVHLLVGSHLPVKGKNLTTGLHLPPRPGGGGGIKQNKEMYYLSLSLKMISFVLFPQASLQVWILIYRNWSILAISIRRIQKRAKKSPSFPVHNHYSD